MHPYQKMAWYNLGVVLFTVTVLISLYATTGNLGGSLAAFACLALLGFSGLFLAAGKKGTPLWDEYHRDINRRAWNVGMNLFWIYFVICSTGLMTYFKQSVPTDMFALFFWSGFSLLMAIYSIALLALYGSDSTERITLLDRWRRMNELRKVGFGMLVIFWIVGLPFLLMMSGTRKEEAFDGFMLAVDISFLITYLLAFWSIGLHAGNNADRYLVRRARKQSLITMAISALAVLAVFSFITLLPGIKPPSNWAVMYHVFFVLFIGLVTLPLGLVIQGKIRAEIRIIPHEQNGHVSKKTEAD